MSSALPAAASVAGVLLAVEVHHPGIDSLRLTPQVARAWTERLAHIRDTDGQPLRPRVNYRSELVYVRAFYQDMWQTIAQGRTWRGDLINKSSDGGATFDRNVRVDRVVEFEMPLIPPAALYPASTPEAIERHQEDQR